MYKLHLLHLFILGGILWFIFHMLTFLLLFFSTFPPFNQTFTISADVFRMAPVKLLELCLFQIKMTSSAVRQDDLCLAQ